MVLRPEQFTEQAQDVLRNSQELVRHYQHSQWDVEHILLALLELENGLPGDIFAAIIPRFTPRRGQRVCWTMPSGNPSALTMSSSAPSTC